MLTSLLPGLRDFRVPLSSGLIWLFGGWLVAEPHLPEGQPEGVLGSVYALDSIFGQAAITAATLFVAYLVGIMLPFYRLPIHRLRLRRDSKNLSKRAVDKATHTDLSNLIHNQLHRAVGTLLLRGDFDTTFVAGKSLDQLETEMRAGMQNEVLNGVMHEEKALANRLRIQDKVIVFQSYDAKLAEAQFRQGIALPLAALIVVLMVLESKWWGLGLVVPATLIVLAYYSRKEAMSELCQAIVHQLITSTTLESFEELVDRQDASFLSVYLPNEMQAHYGAYPPAGPPSRHEIPAVEEQQPGS